MVYEESPRQHFGQIRRFSVSLNTFCTILIEIMLSTENRFKSEGLAQLVEVRVQEWRRPMTSPSGRSWLPLNLCVQVVIFFFLNDR